MNAKVKKPPKAEAYRAELVILLQKIEERGWEWSTLDKPGSLRTILDLYDDAVIEVKEETEEKAPDCDSCERCSPDEPQYNEGYQ